MGSNIWRPLFSVFLLFFLSLSCEKRNALSPMAGAPDESKETVQSVSNEYLWPESTPEEQGLDSGILASAVGFAENQLQYMTSLLVIRNGYIVTEKYFIGFDRSFPTDVGGISYSILSALIGIAIDQGFIPDVEQRVVDYFPEYTGMNVPISRYNATIAHILTMTSCIPSWNYWDSRDWTQTILQQPEWIIGPYTIEPGDRFQLSPGAAHLLSGIITKTTFMSTKEFAENYLFGPLNIHVYYWERAPEGYYTWGRVLLLKPRALARFGQLYLNGGIIDESPIVSEDWIEASISQHNYFQMAHGVFGNVQYGYSWYFGRVKGYDIYYAQGHWGQNIFNIPELNMIIVSTASNDPGEMVSELIANYCIAAVIDGNSSDIPRYPVNVSVTPVFNRSLTQTEQVNIIRWQPNPLNENMDISGYRIYLIQDGDRRLLGAVDPETFEFLHRDRRIKFGTLLTYGLSSVTQDRLESIVTFVRSESTD